MQLICIDPKHRATQTLLETLGFSSVKAPDTCRSEVYSHRVTLNDKSDGNGLVYDLLGAVSELSITTERLLIDDELDFLTHADAELAAKLLESRGDKFRRLFDGSQCPGSSTATTDIMLNMARLFRSARNRMAGYETDCQLYDVFDADDLVGIYVTENIAPPSIRAFGKSVAMISQNTVPLGSAVLVDHADANLLSAAHVMFAGKELESGLAVHTAGKRIPIDRTHVVRVDMARDVVEMYIPELQTSQKIASADAPPLPGDIVWHVGFPVYHRMAVSRMYQYARALATYNGGQFTATGRTMAGQSGGLSMNASGEVLGVVSMRSKVNLRIVQSISSNFLKNYDPRKVSHAKFLTGLLQLAEVSKREMVEFMDAAKQYNPALQVQGRNWQEVRLLCDVLKHCVHRNLPVGAWMRVYQDSRAWVLSHASDYLRPDSNQRWRDVQNTIKSLVSRELSLQSQNRQQRQ